MTSWTYRKGLHDVGNGLFAYLQPDGGQREISINSANGAQEPTGR